MSSDVDVYIEIVCIGSDINISKNAGVGKLGKSD